MLKSLNMFHWCNWVILMCFWTNWRKNFILMKNKFSMSKKQLSLETLKCPLFMSTFYVHFVHFLMSTSRFWLSSGQSGRRPPPKKSKTVLPKKIWGAPPWIEIAPLCEAKGAYCIGPRLEQKVWSSMST